MFRFTHLAALAAIPLTALSLCASAQQDPVAAPVGHPLLFQHMLQKMDTNGDGRVSLDEYLAAANAHFKSIDSQHKGSVDAADIASSPEATARIDHRAQSMVKRLDTAGNGFVTQDEFVAAAQQRFARLDENADGKLTPDELTAARRHHGSAEPANGKSNKRAQFARHFDKIDANHDGVVTIDEYVSAARTLYAQFDSAHDGKVTAAEIESSPRTQERAVHVADRMVRHMDANGDGVVSQDEFVAAAKTRFARIDKNGDGFIDADEASGRRWAGRGHKPQG
jgi:Ca2+-binding EF-hand superfamily protein